MSPVAAPAAIRLRAIDDAARLPTGAERIDQDVREQGAAKALAAAQVALTSALAEADPALPLRAVRRDFETEHGIAATVWTGVHRHGRAQRQRP